MGAVKVTSKGQVTIPKNVRDRLGIRTGTEVEFMEDEDGRVFLSKVDDIDQHLAVVRSVAGSLSSGWTTERIMKLTRGDDWVDGEPPSVPPDPKRVRAILQDHQRKHGSGNPD